jgi:hypothetical protein
LESTQNSSSEQRPSRKQLGRRASDLCVEYRQQSKADSGFSAADWRRRQKEKDSAAMHQKGKRGEKQAPFVKSKASASRVTGKRMANQRDGEVG